MRGQITPNKEQPATSLAEFFMNVAPGTYANVAGVLAAPHDPKSKLFVPLGAKTLMLFCESSSCGGLRHFGSGREIILDLTAGTGSNTFNTFSCRNCGLSHKTYAIYALYEGGIAQAKLIKYGETPSFGLPTPPRLISLLRTEKDYYIKGRRAENQGMGIAAFAYYRRVVENQKTQLLNAIIAVSQKIGADEDILNDLRAAQRETQFNKAVGAIKRGIPQSLLVGGHNPLTLLHDALSEGLHAQTDEECLEIAISVRIILTDLVERIGLALEEHQELTGAVNKLLRIKSQRTQGNSKPKGPASATQPSGS